MPAQAGAGRTRTDGAQRRTAAEPGGRQRKDCDKRPAQPPRRSTVAPVRSLPVRRSRSTIDAELTRRWLVEFLRDEVQRRRGFEKVVIGLSGGVDSSLVAYLAAEALGRRRTCSGVRMPYRTSSPESLEHAQLVIDALGIAGATVDISAAVDG